MEEEKGSKTPENKSPKASKSEEPMVELQYIGRKKNFVCRGYDFSKGSAKVPKSLSVSLLERSPRSFKQV